MSKRRKPALRELECAGNALRKLGECSYAGMAARELAAIRKLVGGDQ